MKVHVGVCVEVGVGEAVAVGVQVGVAVLDGVLDAVASGVATGALVTQLYPHPFGQPSAEEQTRSCVWLQASGVQATPGIGVGVPVASGTRTQNF